MKALVRDRYGLRDLRVEEIEKPAVEDGRVLVRVRASSINKADWYGLLGKPSLFRPMMGGIFKPKGRQVGTDFAGIVEAVGNGVEGYAVGDEVFGGRDGAYAEYVSAKNFARKPAGVCSSRPGRSGSPG